MKIKIACFSVLTLIAAFWACWFLAYQRGYSRGASDEFASWKQLPSNTGAGAQWDWTVVGRRDIRLLPGGKEGPPSLGRIDIPGVGVNGIPSSSLK